MYSPHVFARSFGTAPAKREIYHAPRFISHLNGCLRPIRAITALSEYNGIVGNFFDA
jgi:hypothetical protein